MSKRHILTAIAFCGCTITIAAFFLPWRCTYYSVFRSASAVLSSDGTLVDVIPNPYSRFYKVVDTLSGKDVPPWGYIAIALGVAGVTAVLASYITRTGVIAPRLAVACTGLGAGLLLFRFLDQLVEAVHVGDHILSVIPPREVWLFCAGLPVAVTGFVVAFLAEVLLLRPAARHKGHKQTRVVGLETTAQAALPLPTQVSVCLNVIVLYAAAAFFSFALCVPVVLVGETFDSVRRVPSDARFDSYDYTVTCICIVSICTVIFLATAHRFTLRWPTWLGTGIAMACIGLYVGWKWMLWFAKPDLYRDPPIFLKNALDPFAFRDVIQGLPGMRYIVDAPVNHAPVAAGFCLTICLILIPVVYGLLLWVSQRRPAHGKGFFSTGIPEAKAWQWMVPISLWFAVNCLLVITFHLGFFTKLIAPEHLRGTGIASWTAIWFLLGSIESIVYYRVLRAVFR